MNKSQQRAVAMQPGRPGRGYDPTAGFTDMQWYMYHQRNVAYFAAFSGADFDHARVVATARGLLEQAPQFGLGYRAAGRPPTDAVLARLARIETVESFEGLPDRWLGVDTGQRVYADPDLPLFRLRIARRADGPDGEGRRSLLLVHVAHPLTEGSDSALLSRSHSAAHTIVASATEATPARIAVPARSFGAFAAVMHPLVSRLYTPHPGEIGVATRVYPRALFSCAARQLGIRQRALFLALVAHVIMGAGTREAKRRAVGTYSTLDPGGGAHRDAFMRMRMLLARFDNRPNFPEFARSVDARLQHEGEESGFNAEMNAAAIGTHRRLARRLPFLYGPKVFSFMPYDFIFALLPPHRLGGALAADLIEPLYAGAPVPGANGCVVVPGRVHVTFNFFLEEKLLPQVGRLDTILERLRNLSG